MRRIRVNWTIDPRAVATLQKAASHGNMSIGRLVDQLVFQKLSDPVKQLREENKDLARRIHRNLDVIKELEEDKKTTQLSIGSTTEKKQREKAMTIIQRH